MAQVTVEHNPSDAKLDVLGVEYWPIWQKEISTFPWTYEQDEACYILAGEVTVTCDSGEQFLIQKGDLVHFSKGLSCQWQISQAIKKHYRFSQ
jgi:uncharacterized cupin superfamily protein